MDAPHHPLTATRALRSALHEERHPNAVTGPPLHRGSMPTQPWRGFWKSLFAASLLRLTARRKPPELMPAEPWQQAARARRLVLMLATLASTGLASWLFAHLQPDLGNVWLSRVQLLLFALLSAWVVTGFLTALMGFYVSLRGDRHALSVKKVLHHRLNPGERTAIVMAICHEDVSTVFAGLRATCESLAATGQAQAFDVFVLSDSQQPTVQQAERRAWEDLRTALTAPSGLPLVEVYYRLRTRRTQRKSGNVADFCRRWGKDYAYMVVLDADSVMSGNCLVNMVKLMQATPRAGIVQTATQSIGHLTLHARAQQFASRVTGRLFTLGMQFWQMGESHYWGHNAIIRMAPFMQHCGLAPIAGTGGMAGGILSHDFVEAALMRRAGYQVWLVSDLIGSYEQQPPDLLSELQRDRRWCQGNLQNARLIAEPGLHPVHRCMFATGAMAYLSAPLWLAFLALGTTLWMNDAGAAPAWWAVPAELRGLWLWTLSLLFLPRGLGLLAVVLKGQQSTYGGVPALLGSAALETMLALLQAPVRMLAHCLFVLLALTGLTLNWQSPPREAAGVAWPEATLRLAPMTVVAALLGLGVAALNASALMWLAPVALPLLLSVPMTVTTSQVALGRWMRDRNWLLVPEESWSPAVLRRAWQHASALAIRSAG